MTSVERDPDTYQIIGAAMAVHTELGCGFLEAVYKAALPIEFERRGVLYKPEVRVCPSTTKASGCRSAIASISSVRAVLWWR
jgi:PD-(D/E)XK nuclease superfamily